MDHVDGIGTNRLAEREARAHLHNTTVALSQFFENIYRIKQTGRCRAGPSKFQTIAQPMSWLNCDSANLNGMTYAISASLDSG